MFIPIRMAAGVLGMTLAVDPCLLMAAEQNKAARETQQGSPKQQQQKRKAAPAREKAAGPRTAQGAVMVRDAETGELRPPTEEEFQELQAPVTRRPSDGDAGEPVSAAAGRKSPSPRPSQQLEVEHPDGAVSITLDESMTSYTVARRTADGKIVKTETTGVKAANAAVSQGAKKAVATHAK